MSKSFINKKSNADSSPDYKLGMFPGVFTPSILTILGIILFLRMGYTVGHAGLGKALILVGLASLVSILTTTSLSAIATNIHVKGGGAYYLIARTLGVQFGGAIGLVLFLAQSVSIAFYCIGFQVKDYLSGYYLPFFSCCNRVYTWGEHVRRFKGTWQLRSRSGNRRRGHCI